MRRARIAVCGAGWWAQGWHLPQLSRNPLSEIAAIVEPNPAPRSAISTLETTAQLGKHYGAPTFSSIEELLSSETSASVDGVIVCTSHHTHAHIGTAALRAGKHVFMEKPMSTDVAEARALLAAAEAAAPLAFMVNNTANWQPQVQLAAEAVANGRIGDVEHVMCCMHSPLLWLFDDSSNEGWTAPTGGMVGNGFGWGQLSHLLAWVFEVTKLEPVQVFASMSHSAASGADMTNAAVITCLTRDGKPASISLSGVATVPGNAHAEDVAHSVGKRVEVQIFGSVGMIAYGGDDQRRGSGHLELRTRGGEVTRLHDEFAFEDYDSDGIGPAALQSFVKACVGQPYRNGADAWVGLQSVRAIETMYRSASSGKAEKVSC